MVLGGFRTNEVYEAFLSLNSVSALRLGSVIHSDGLVFYLATHRKRRGIIFLGKVKAPTYTISYFVI